MDLPGVQPFILEGRIRAIAVLNDRRSAALPCVASSVEQGAKELMAVNWYGLLAPDNTPEPVADADFFKLFLRPRTILHEGKALLYRYRANDVFVTR